MWKIVSFLPLILVAIALAPFALAGRNDLSSAILKAKKSEVRVDLLELQLKKPPIDFFAPFKALSKEAPEPASKDPETELSPFLELDKHLGEVEARLGQLFHRQSLSIALWETTPQDRVNRHYTAIIDTLGYLCCGKSPNGTDPAVMRKLMVQHGMEPTVPHPAPGKSVP